MGTVKDESSAIHYSSLIAGNQGTIVQDDIRVHIIGDRFNSGIAHTGTAGNQRMIVYDDLHVHTIVIDPPNFCPIRIEDTGLCLQDLCMAP